ncbi:hypothetical protein GOV10_01205, partial [Candidatus Woesearchaeota archaeon]|nr:hypothetical protein [Candidatus Woesearchaeota archaeon]
MVLGTSKIIVEDDDVIGTQVERVTRDWYGMNIPADPEHTVNVDKILNYHEGARTKDILSIIEGELKPLTGTIVAKLGNGWYAPDENGVFKFEVLPDKVQYPTTVRLDNFALLSDTHGISSLVQQAIEQKVDLVVGCGDYIGKMQAANHLSQKGVDVYFPCDRFVCDVIGYEGPGILIGSAPVNEVDGKAVIGNQPLTIDLDERIIVQNTEKLYPAQYYDAGRRYFEALEERSGIDLNLLTVNVDNLRETYKVTKMARAMNAHVIAARVA